MAVNCKDCGASFSCGCQLTKGRCSSCNYIYQQSLKEPVKPYSEEEKYRLNPQPIIKT